MKTIEEILKTDDAHREMVKVERWGTDVLVVSMTAEERSDIEKKWSGKKATTDPGGFRADVLERSMKKDDGTPFASTEQIKQLMKKNAEAVETVFEAACKISGFRQKDVAELEKN